ncbi:MAG TPA: hypothetical protein VFA60_10150 [Terriglobales bacterium]|nr:hypothetical protein [Terriglobales bacterium]
MLVFYIALVVSVLALVWAGIAIFLRVRRHMSESAGNGASRNRTKTGSRDEQP